MVDSFTYYRNNVIIIIVAISYGIQNIKVDILYMYLATNFTTLKLVAHSCKYPYNVHGQRTILG